jgi:molecular chaperone GrpE
VTEEQARPAQGDATPEETAEQAGSFGEAAAEMPNETEVEAPFDGSGLQSKIDELTGDLQRLQAEYLNYKRRVERDRELIRENATYAALAPIVEVLDAIDRAREHGPLEDGFKAVADQLEGVVAGLGLTKFGQPGEVFDPTLHEALSHLGTDADVTETTVKVIAKAGYRIGERVVRAAQVLVVDPE